MKTIFFTGGGTLGPVTPLLAVYQELIRTTPLLSPPYQGGDRGGRVVWIGTKHGPEREKLKLFPEIVFEYLPEAKFDRFFSLRLLISPFQFFAAILKSLVLIIRYRPSLIVGSGGFMQVPLMWVGKQFGVPCLIHQIDVAPTLSNRLCAWVAAKITVNFEETAKQFPAHKTIVVGNPVFVPSKPPRPDQSIGTPLLRKEGTMGDVSSPYEGEELGGVTFGSSKPLLVVIGGGTGAEQLNRLTLLTADELTKMFNVVLISGGRPMGRDTRSCVSTEGLIVTSFVQDTYHLLERADMVVTRAGMATLTEVACLGKPTVIVPIPHSHQEANARYYEEKEAARVFWCDYDETETRAGEFMEIIKELWNEGKRREMLVGNIKKLYNKEATRLIVEEIQKF